MTPSFYILDGYAYIYQAFYALSKLHAPDGTPSNAVFGFTRLLIKILKKNCNYLAICLDSPGCTFRKQIYEPYKMTRKPMPDTLRIQIPIIKDIVSAYRIPILEIENYEADDAMATLACYAARQKIEVYIFTLDKDLQQLVNDRIKIYDTKKDCVIGPDQVRERFELEPQQLPDYFALVGDSIDNIPGVKGIGPKTAANLLKKWETLQRIYEHVEEVTPGRIRNLLLENRESAFLSRKLFVLEEHAKLDIDMSKFQVKKPDTEKLRCLFLRLGFRKLLADLEVDSIRPKQRTLEEARDLFSDL